MKNFYKNIPFSFLSVAANVQFSELEIGQSVFVTDRSENRRHLLAQRGPVGVELHQPSYTFVAIDFILKLKVFFVKFFNQNNKSNLREDSVLENTRLSPVR